MLLEVVGEFKTISYDRHPKNMECNYQHSYVAPQKVTTESYYIKLVSINLIYPVFL